MIRACGPVRAMPHALKRGMKQTIEKLEIREVRCWIRWAVAEFLGTPPSPPSPTTEKIAIPLTEDSMATAKGVIRWLPGGQTANVRLEAVY